MPPREKNAYRNDILLQPEDNHSHAKAHKHFVLLFREQANKHPNQTILTDAYGGHLTYRELDRKSDNLANFLKKRGIKSNNLVGLCASLSTDFIVSMLGIIKSGAAYFPLDPEYPIERLEYMINEANPLELLVAPEFSYLFKKSNKIEINETIFKKTNKTNHEYNNIQPDNLAYVIYTSGSTGNPKGIMVSHKSLPHIACAHTDYYPPGMRMLLAGGVCFDASLLVVFHALANNSPLYLFGQKDKNSVVDDLFNFIQLNSINFMISVPSQYLKLLQKGSPLPSLKCVSLTGENLPSSLCSLHSELATNAILYNEYGPTEYAIGTTIARIYNPENKSISPINVGNPLPETQVYILDDNLNILSKESKGEICIGGIGLAQGYLNNEELTSQKFVDAKNISQKTLRLYRTGDIGRFLPNGSLEFLGRFDHTVLLSRTKINLGEIEYSISSQCPYILESAVLISQKSQEEKQILIYFTSSIKSAEKSLTKHLKSILPTDILFSVIQINRFPLSPNGKIDRTALMKIP